MDTKILLQEFILNSPFQQPDKICMELEENGHWYRLTYSEFKQEINAYVEKLSTIGIKPGQRVILLSINKPITMIVYFALLACKATPVFLDPHLPRAELNKLITFVNSNLLFIDSNLLSEINPASLPNIEIRNLQNFDICKKGRELNSNTADDDQEIAGILFTSGTTGFHKGVMLTHSNFIESIKQSKIVINLSDIDRMLTILPIHHISPLLQNLVSLYAGSTLIFVNKLEGSIILSTMQAAKPTIIGVVPAVLNAFLDKIENEIRKSKPHIRAIVSTLILCSQSINKFFGSNVGFYLFKKIQKAFGGHLNRIICGGAAANPAVVTKLHTFGFRILEAYGLTEVTGPICSNRIKKIKIGTVGQPFSGIEIKVNKLTGQHSGEVCVKGPMVMKGYFKDETATNNAIKDNWFHTGDTGYFTKQGKLVISGRIKETIVLKSGKKINPADVEEYYQSIPGVAELAVFGMHDFNQHAEQIHAAVVLQEALTQKIKNHEDTIENIQRQIEEKIYECGSKLGPTLQVQRIHILNEIPKTAMGKVKRTLLPSLLMDKSHNTVASEVKTIKSTQTQYPTDESIAPSIELNDLEAWLVDWIANRLSITPSSIKKHQSFIYYGLGSLDAIELCTDLQNWLSIAINPAAIWEHHTPEKLSFYLYKKLNLSPKASENPVAIQNQEDNEDNDNIAIIGIACHFPGEVKDPESFWSLLSKGQSGISQTPSSRWNMDEFYDVNPDTPGKINTKWGGFIEGINHFDANFFEISPHEAVSIDPQHRLLLELSWQALERAAIAPSSLAGSETGVYVAIGTNDYAALQADRSNLKNISAYYGVGNSFSAASGRIAYFYGLQGICKSVDTACSSSLVAIHDACKDLLKGETSLAIVGAANALLSPVVSISLSKAKMLAPDGQCKVFDANADGYVRGEGCAVIVLKRLKDAIAQGDPIVGVIVGSGVNQDGHSNGLTAPNVEAQEKLFRKTLRNANLMPNQISYIETHGTGTPLGDPIEVRSINKVFAENRSPDQPLHIGAVKSNIGHLEAAAGMAGLIKVLLMLQSKKIPQQINFSQLNPWINADKINIPRQLLAWQNEQGPLYAAVNSFGFTGTNAQIILSEPPNNLLSDQQSNKPFYLITLSAKTGDILRQRLMDLEAWLQKKLSISLSSLSYTLNKGRDHFKKRCAFVVNSCSDLQQQIHDYLANNTKQGTNISDQFSNSKNIISELAASVSTPKKYFDLLTEIAALYIRGENFNWDDLYHGESKQSVVLPTYPFAKQSYWVDVATTNESTKNSLLGFQVQPSSKGLLFKNKIRVLDKNHYLCDHKILGQLIFPGSGYVELLLSAGQHIFNSASFSLENISFERVLGLNESLPTTIQLEAVLDAEQAETYQLAIHSLNKQATQQSWQQHTRCKLMPSQENPSSIRHDLANLKSNKQEIPISDAYQVLDKAGFNYGSDFRTVKQLWVHETEALAELETLLPTAEYTCHPALMDGCFQLVGMMLLEKIKQVTDEIFLPSSVTSVVINQPLAQKLFVLVKLKTVTNTHVSADFELLDSSGQVIGKITGFNLKSINKNTFLHFHRDTNYLNNLFYQLTWQQSSDVGQMNDQISHEGTWFVLGRETDSMVNEVTAQLQQQGETVQAFNSQSLTTFFAALKQHSIKGIVVLNDMKHDEQAHCKTLLMIIQKLVELQQAIKLWVVTCGTCSVQGEVPADFSTATLWGMGKALNLEQRQIKCTLVDLDPLMSIEASAKAFIHELSHQAEEQIALRLTGRWVARLMGNEKAATDLSLPPAQENYQLCASESRLIEDLKFISIPKQALKPHEIAIEVKAAALNFRDTLNALGLYPDKVPLGIDCAGIVVEVGSQVKNLRVGDGVFGLVPGCFADRITTDVDNVVLKPKNLSFSEAATIPAVFLTAYYALHEMVPTLKNKRILIHTASGGLGLAAIQIAKLAGAEIFATAGSEEKRAYLRSLNIKHVFDSRSLSFGPAIQAATDQQGVDIVLNTLTGKDFIPTTLSACAKHAYFIELSKRDIWTAEQVAAVRSDIHYEILALDALADKNRLQNIFNTLLPLFASGQLQPLTFRSYSFANAVLAFQAMRQAKHVGKLILVSETRWEKQRAAAGLHVITGGLGGLGLAITEWMLAHGAQHIILVNRSAIKDDNVLASLKSQYPEASLETYQADISERTQVERLMAYLQEQPQPLRGIVHAAGVLQDAMLSNQTWEKYEAVFAPKIKGAWHLHQLTQNMNLDYFVLFSSAASLLGSPGQSNHAAANAYLDALAHYRRCHGLAATSINWGAWSEIGCAANVNALFESYGLRWLAPADGVAAFGEVMNKTHDAQIGIMPIEWNSYFQWLGGKPRWLSKVGNESTGRAAKSKLTLKEILAKSSPDHYEVIIKDYIKDTLRQILKLDQSHIFDEQKALGDLGMDSLMAMEFGSYLQKHFENTNFPETFIFNNASIHTLSVEILRLLNGAPQTAPEVKLKEADLEIIDEHINSIIHPKLSLRLAQKFLRPTLFALSKKYFQIEVKGQELLPQNEPYILCANHLSSLDGLALLLAAESHKNNFVILLADNHFYKSKSIFAIGDAVPFDRTRNDYTLQKNIAYLKRLKEQNKCFILFPEGTRSEDGNMKEFKNGVAWFAHKVGLKVVPAYIEGTYQLLPRSARFPKPGKLKVAIGEAFGFDADSPTQLVEFNMSRYEEFTTKLKNEILNLKKLF